MCPNVNSPFTKEIGRMWALVLIINSKECTSARSINDSLMETPQEGHVAVIYFLDVLVLGNNWKC